MAGDEMLEKLGESLGSKATVKAVFGEPIQAAGKTIIPVAKVSYGFGGGFGAGRPRNPEETGRPKSEGGGGGGGVRAFPAGALEITPGNTRFIPFTDPRWLVAAFTVGAFAGRLFFRRKL
jgi:uncharacterized spore protein YtfJ